MADTNQLTLADIQSALPSRKGAITEDIVDIFNRAQTEAEFQGESLLQTAVTYEQVMKRNKVGIKDYLNAIRFCAYLISMDDNYTEAFRKTFYARDFVKKFAGMTASNPRYGELTSAASRYRKSKVVADILTLSQVPMELMFTGARYKAVGVLADMMVTARLDRDKIAAAKELLAATKNENIKIDLDIEVKESSAVQQLNEQLASFASTSIHHLETGTTTTGELGALKVKDSDAIDAEIG